MKLKINNAGYKCVMFLRDTADMAMLKPYTPIYGKVIESTRTVFITPYKPPANSWDVVAVVGNTQRRKRSQAHHAILSMDETGMTVKGFVNNNWLEIPVAVVYADACYERTPFNKLEMDLLWNSDVLILGCGTGGSKIAIELTRAGVGKLTLCDPDRLEYANISRHEGNLLDVGKPKTQVVAEKVYSINPAVQVETFFEDIFERTFDQVKRIFNTKNLIVAATDKTAAQLQANELAHNLGIPAVFSGCYEEARGGEVFFTLPEKKMPCLACLRSGLKQPQKNRKIDYSTATSAEDYRGQPGLHAAVDFLTCVEVQICFGVLLRNSKTSQLGKFVNSIPNFLLIGSALGQGFYRFRKPFDVFFQPLTGPRKNCPVCQKHNLTLHEEDTKPA